MATYRVFCYNPSPNPLIANTEQVGSIAAANGAVTINSSLEWWNGPDEDLGYIIAYVDPSGDRPNGPERILGTSTTCHLGFFRSETKTEASFVELAKVVSGSSSLTLGTQSKEYLNSIGMWTSYSVYSIALGTKSATLGNGGQSPFPATGWTSLVSSSADDTFTQVDLPFTWTFNGTPYTSFFPNSNAYITFGSGSSQYSGLGANSPNLNKIFISGADNSWQRVSKIESTNKYIRLRWEGTAATTGSPGSPNMVYELTFFNPTFTGGENWIELLIGNLSPRPGSISGIYSSTALLTGGQMVSGNGPVAALQSYVLAGNSSGTSWTVYTGYHIGGTDY